MKGFLNVAYAAKAWAALLTQAVTQVVAAVQVAAADQAISLDEATGIWLLATEAVGVLVTVGAVFGARNAPAPGSGSIGG